MLLSRLLLGFVLPTLLVGYLGSGCLGAVSDSNGADSAEASLEGARASAPEKYILYLHGRGGGEWDGRFLAKVPGWKNVTIRYNGSSDLDDGFIVERLENTIQQYCSGTRACVLACHSAGCMRTLLVLDNLEAKRKKVNVLWVAASASAAGGTRMAEISTPFGWGKAPIDEDLRRDRARGSSGWGHIQDAMRSSTMYHLAGRNNECVARFVCGNTLLPAGTCDGVLCMDSAAGASEAGSVSNGCDVAKYPGRVYDKDASPCDGLQRNHTWMGLDLGKITEKTLKAGR